MPEEANPDLAQQSKVMPDYKGNPRVATADDMLELITQAYHGL